MVQIGLWIDHARAVLARLEDGSFGATRTITSEVAPHVRLSGGARSATPYGPQEHVSDTQRDRRFRGHLVGYYRRVLRELDDADEILLMGPGEAKEELRRELFRVPRLVPRLVSVQSADKLTERQLKARVRQFFGIPAPRARRAQGRAPAGRADRHPSALE